MGGNYRPIREVYHFTAYSDSYVLCVVFEKLDDTTRIISASQPDFPPNFLIVCLWEKRFVIRPQSLKSSPLNLSDTFDQFLIAW